jgi:hypothetical protein
MSTYVQRGEDEEKEKRRWLSHENSFGKGKKKEGG